MEDELDEKHVPGKEHGDADELSSSSSDDENSSDDDMKSPPKIKRARRKDRGRARHKLSAMQMQQLADILVLKDGQMPSKDSIELLALLFVVPDRHVRKNLKRLVQQYAKVRTALLAERDKERKDNADSSQPMEVESD